MTAGAHMKALLGVIAGIVALAGFTNFFASLNTQTPIPIGLSQPLAMLAMAYLLFQHIFPAMMYRAGPEPRKQAIQTLLATGAVQAKTSCGGYIGALQFRGPLLQVEVYPGGMLIKPWLMPAVAILNTEILDIQPRTVWLSQVVEISHTSQLVASPIRLTCGQGNQVRQLLLTRSG